MYRTPLAGSSASGGSGIGRGSTRHPIKRCRLISHRLHLPPEQPRHLLQLQEECGKPSILDQKPQYALQIRGVLPNVMIRTCEKGRKLLAPASAVVRFRRCGRRSRGVEGQTPQQALHLQMHLYRGLLH